MNARFLDAPLAARAVQRARPGEMILVLAEDRQHVIPAPALKTELPPAIVVGCLPTHVDHGVDRRTSADDLAARIGQRTAIQAGFVHRLEHPIRARIANGEKIADGNVKPDPVILAARLQQQHAIARVG